MSNRFSIFSFIVVVLMGAIELGCSSSIRNFARPDAEMTRLGQTTYEHVLQWYGKPYNETTSSVNNKELRTVSYAYVYYSEVSISPGGGLIPARAMAFHFHEGVLVGHEFTSSFQEDNTDFDESRIERIKKGRTTCSQVIELLGSPSGEYMYPLVPDRDHQAIVYMYAHSKGRTGPPPQQADVKNYKQIHIITHDRKDVITAVSYSSSGDR